MDLIKDSDRYSTKQLKDILNTMITVINSTVERVKALEETVERMRIPASSLPIQRPVEKKKKPE